MERGGFEPPNQNGADLQSAAFNLTSLPFHNRSGLVWGRIELPTRDASNHRSAN